MTVDPFPPLDLTDQSKAHYRRVLQSFARASGMSLADPAFGQWALRAIDRDFVAGTITKATLRQYRSVIRWWMRCNGLKEAAPRPIPEAVRRPPRRKRRVSLTPRQLGALTRFADARRSQLAIVAVAFFRAGIYTGVSPCEWAGAVLEARGQDEGILVVRNARFLQAHATHGLFGGQILRRAQGETRALHLLDAQAYHEANQAILSEGKYPWRRHKDGIRVAFKRLIAAAINEQILPAHCQHLSITTSRHIFASEAKKALDIETEVPALLGHRSSRAVTTRCGRRHLGGVFGIHVAPSRETLWPAGDADDGSSEQS